MSARDLLAKEQPNVLFIIVDTLRSDHLGCYGYQDIKTPNIDGIAKRGTLFENVIASAPLTLPSHASIFTSTFPQFNKVRDNGSYQLPENSITLADRFKENKYNTAAFVSTVVLDKKYGLDKGFDVYDDKMVKSPQKQLIKSMEGERAADKTTAAALEWLEENKEEKFFLWVHYYDPHTVYNPPPPYSEIYKDNLYAGEIAFVDHYIGILLDALKKLGLEDNTIIIFAGDHGEGLGEHQEAQHAVFLYDTTLKVPLIFSYPKKIPQSKVIKEQVRLVDIMPTLLDLVKIKKNKDIQGRSLLKAMRGKARLKAIPAYSESYYAKFHYNWSELQSWRTEEWKYIRSSEPELFNIQEDPLELNNLIHE
ncbi:MAG: sulfatase [Candidatus Orphnella occulta]|nr:sulfatase [Candidatus Orphnella occulta]